jgi:hypothetical protein
MLLLYGDHLEVFCFQVAINKMFHLKKKSVWLGPKDMRKKNEIYLILWIGLVISLVEFQILLIRLRLN